MGGLNPPMTEVFLEIEYERYRSAARHGVMSQFG